MVILMRENRIFVDPRKKFLEKVGGDEMVLLNISTLVDRISLIMHILIVSNGSRLLWDDFRGFHNFLEFFWA